MIMKKKLADELMNLLACLAVSANGGIPQGGLSREQTELIETYAREKFLEITNDWEVLMGETWEIEED